MQAIFDDRFEDVVHGLHFEGADGVLVVRCDEHDHRLMDTGDASQHLEAVLTGHLDVEQEKVGPLVDDRLHGCGPVRGFPHELEVGFLGQHRPQPPAGERFVIDDERADSRRISCHDAVVRYGSSRFTTVPRGVAGDRSNRWLAP